MFDGVPNVTIHSSIRITSQFFYEKFYLHPSQPRQFNRDQLLRLHACHFHSQYTKCRRCRANYALNQ
jgi:hypothetical protein